MSSCVIVDIQRCLISTHLYCVAGAIFWQRRYSSFHDSSGRELADVPLPIGASALHVRRQHLRWRLHISTLCRPGAHHGARRRRSS